MEIDEDEEGFGTAAERQANRASDEARRLREAIERVRPIVDVMVGDGPGAIAAYHRHEDRVADGLPTEFAQMREHAKAIREILNEVGR